MTCDYISTRVSQSPTILGSQYSSEAQQWPRIALVQQCDAWSGVKNICIFTVDPYPVVLRKRSGSKGGAAEAEMLKWLFILRCPPCWRSERASEAAEVKAVEAIKCFNTRIFARIAAFAATHTDVERSLLASCLRSRRARQAIRSLVIAYVGHCLKPAPVQSYLSKTVLWLVRIKN